MPTSVAFDLFCSSAPGDLWPFSGNFRASPNTVHLRTKLDENNPKVRAVDLAVTAGAQGIARHLAFDSTRNAASATGNDAPGGEFFK